MTDVDHDEHDGCSCGTEHPRKDPTPDEALPAAVGGVVERKRRRKPTKTAVKGDT